MGIGSTMKNMLSTSDNPDAETQDIDEGIANLQRNTSRSSDVHDVSNNPTYLTNSNRARKLPSGTGPGTTGKPLVPSEIAMQQDRERTAMNQDISGFGTDAAAASGGTLASTHQFPESSTRRTSDANKRSGLQTSHRRFSDITEESGQAAPVASISVEHDYASPKTTTSGHTGVLDDNHTQGHSKHSPKDNMPTGDAQEDTNQLNPVTHEHIRHIETEDISRIKERERHIHHIQHHTQPIVASEELPVQHHEQIHSVTHISETHANKPEDSRLFEGQIRQHHDTLEHSAKERTVIDKGTTINETVHHHVHHVIQPVIEKETIDRQHIHTTIPIHEVTHEAPVVHQSQTHAPVPLDHFLEKGGSLHGAISQDQITHKVLHEGRCTREVDGVANELENKLDLGKSTHTHIHSQSTSGRDVNLSTKAKRAAQHASSTHADQPIPSTRN